jgi:hypothetical protein
MAKPKTRAWISTLPGALDASRLSELRSAKVALAFLGERIDGPPAIAEYIRAFRFLLFFGLACVAEDKYPPLTRCWRDLERLLMNDPTFDDGIDDGAHLAWVSTLPARDRAVALALELFNTLAACSAIPGLVVAFGRDVSAKPWPTQDIERRGGEARAGAPAVPWDEVKRGLAR